VIRSVTTGGQSPRSSPAATILIVAGLLAAGAARPPTDIAVDWLPAAPVEGGFVQLAVRTVVAPGPVGVEGRLAGQPVRFERDSSGIWQGLAGVPLPSESGITLTLTLRYADGTSREETVALPVTRGNYPVDRLTVAPQYSAPPDSALAARIAREQRRAMDVSRASLGTARLWSGPFHRPRPSRVTSEFGRAREFNGELQSRHMGVDLAGTVGAPVRAANRGVVALVDQTFYGGNVIYLDHGLGLVTAYLHLSAALVARGDTVRQGQLIGRVGATGRVTGPHLHWIARYGTITLDPLSLERLELDRFGPPGP
jgi:murein DD-endopeptidase MepM/ murein hydrolase activator NlpD